VAQENPGSLEQMGTGDRGAADRALLRSCSRSTTIEPNNRAARARLAFLGLYPIWRLFQESDILRSRDYKHDQRPQAATSVQYESSIVFSLRPARDDYAWAPTSAHG